jgi:hypothetical protein
VAEQQGVAQQRGGDIPRPGRVTVDPVENLGVLLLELGDRQRRDARFGHATQDTRN